MDFWDQRGHGKKAMHKTGNIFGQILRNSQKCAKKRKSYPSRYFTKSMRQWSQSTFASKRGGVSSLTGSRIRKKWTTDACAMGSIGWRNICREIWVSFFCISWSLSAHHGKGWIEQLSVQIPCFSWFLQCLQTLITHFLAKNGTLFGQIISLWATWQPLSDTVRRQHAHRSIEGTVFFLMFFWQ